MLLAPGGYSAGIGVIAGRATLLIGLFACDRPELMLAALNERDLALQAPLER